jgi:drug/metabolite transporter (DMT)-like permease
MRIRLPALSARAWALLGAVYLLWGSTYLAIRVAIRTMPPLLMSATRWAVAGTLLYAITLRRTPPEERPTARHWRSAAIIGGALVLGGNGLVSIAEQHIDSSIAALLVATVPMWMALFAWLAFRERLSPLAVAGVVIGFGGTAILVGGNSGSGRTSFLGAGLVLLASFSWAAGSLYATRAPLPRKPLLGASMEMLCGAAWLAIGGLLRGEAGEVHIGRISWESAWGLAHLIVFGSLVAYSAYVWLLSHVRTSIVSTYAYVNPVVAVFLGWSILSEAVTGRTLIGSGIVVAGVAMIVTARAPEEAKLAETPPPATAPPAPPEAVTGSEALPSGRAVSARSRSRRGSRSRRVVHRRGARR